MRNAASTHKTMSQLPDFISICWHLTDIQDRAIEQGNIKPSDDQARQILQRLEKDHDSAQGVCWSSIDYQLSIQEIKADGVIGNMNEFLSSRNNSVLLWGNPANETVIDKIYFDNDQTTPALLNHYASELMRNNHNAEADQLQTLIKPLL